MELLTFKCPKCLLVSPLGATYELIQCTCGQAQFDPLSHIHLGVRGPSREPQSRLMAQAAIRHGKVFMRSKAALVLGFFVFASLMAYPTYKVGLNIYAGMTPKKSTPITITGLAFSDIGSGNYLFSASINNPSGQDIDWPDIKIDLTKQGQIVLTKVIFPEDYLHSSINLEIADPQGKVVYQALTSPQDLLKLHNGRYLLRLSLNLPGAQAAAADNYRLSLEPHAANN